MLWMVFGAVGIVMMALDPIWRALMVLVVFNGLCALGLWFRFRLCAWFLIFFNFLSGAFAVYRLTQTADVGFLPICRAALSFYWVWLLFDYLRQMSQDDDLLKD